MSVTPEKLAAISELCLMDDVFWEVAAKDKEMIQEICYTGYSLCIGIWKKVYH